MKPCTLRAHLVFVLLFPLAFSCLPDGESFEPAISASSRSALYSVGPEVPLSAITPAPAAGGGANPRVASDGARYLVAFTDSRGSFSSVFVYRVKPDGTPEDTLPILIESLSGPAKALDVAYGDGVFLVSWRHDPTSGSTSGELRAVRLSAATGAVLDSTPLVLASSVSTRPRIAFAAGVFGVVWSTNGVIRFRTVPTSGAPTATSTVCGNGTAAIPVIASDGTGFYTAWEDSRVGSPSVYGTTISTAGSVGTTCGLQLVSNGGWPALASSGGNWILAWSSGGSISVARLLTMGSPVGPSSSVASGNYSDPSLAEFGSQLLVTYLDRSVTPPVIKARRITSTGGTSGAQIDTALSGYSSAVASDGSTALVVGEPSGSIVGQRISATGAVLDPMPLQLNPRPTIQLSVVAAPLGTGAIAFWSESQPTQFPDVRGTRVSPSPAPLDDPSIALATGVGDQQVQGVATATSTDTALVVWSDAAGTSPLRATRIDAQGQLLDGTGFTLSSDSSTSSLGVASNGTDWLAGWMDDRGDVYAARVSGSGQVLDSPPLWLASATPLQTPTRVVWSQGAWWVGFTDGPTDGDAWVIRVNAAGVALDASPMAVAMGSGFQQLESLTPIPEGVLALISDDASGTSELSARKLFADGSAGPLVPLTSGGAEHSDPAVLHLPDRELVVWSDFAIRSLELDPATLASLTAPALLADAPGLEYGADLVTLDGGVVLVTYTRSNDETLGSPRVFSRQVTFEGSGADAGSDAGVDADGGTGAEDGGTIDGGIDDGGVSPSSDAGVAEDADGGPGSPSRGPLQLTVSCASTSAGPLQLVATLALATVLIFARARRQGR